MSFMRALTNYCAIAPSCCSFALFSFVIFGFTTSSHAASINYGNFNIPSEGITFENVTESSTTDPVPMFNAPSPYAIGLDFDPTNFNSVSLNGNADVTIGQLNFTVDGLSNANGLVGIDAITLTEKGDYSLAGAGGPNTSVFAGASLLAKITEIDGVAVAPITLPQENAIFSDALPGVTISAPWSIGITLNIAAGLVNEGFPTTANATRVEVVIVNTLISTSEPGNVAAITKTDFEIDLDTEIVRNPIPEPASTTLAIVALFGIAASRTRYPGIPV